MSALDDEELDALLRARAPQPRPGEPTLDAGELQAWRTGRLDPERAAAIEEILARSAADRATLGDLAQPVDDRLLDRMAAATPRSRTARRYAWLGAGLALAAGLTIAILRPSPADAPAYTLSAVRGAVKATRAEAPVEPADSPAVFVPHGTLRLTVRPATEATASAARAFAACGDDALKPVDGLSPGAAGAWTLVASARTLFGEPPARCVVGVGLAAEAGALDGLSGVSAAEAAHVDGVSWVPLTVDYRAAPPAEAP